MIREKDSYMIETIGILLLLFWLLGMGTAYTLGGLLHILLVIVIVLVIVRAFAGQKVL